MYSDVFRCSNCGHRLNRLHPKLSAMLTFVFSPYTHCIRCGAASVHRLTKRDRIDSVSRNPISVLLRLTGAPLIKCPACRLQYSDWRRPRPDST